MTSLQPAATTATTSTAGWNTHSLGMRLAGDATAAAAAGGLVAPLISIIDRGIIENASGRATLAKSIATSISHMFLSPHRFLVSRQFLLVFGLYGGTYLAANLLDTATSVVTPKNASSVNAGTTKFATTSAANITLCLYKDSQFTRMFGVGAATRVPLVSYALFAARDSLTVFASFNLPPAIAPHLPVGEVERYMSRASIAQFLAPASIQIISTPLHLLGLDLYNRPATSAASRASKIIRDWGKSCIARICRIIPAFGVGGIVNTTVRREWQSAYD